MESLKEIKQFLNTTARLDLKVVAVTHIRDLTGSEDGRKLLISCPDTVNSVIQLTWDESEVIAKDAALTLINISAEENGSRVLLDQHEQISGIVQIALEMIFNENCTTADIWCTILCNITRYEELVDQVLDEITKLDNQIDKLVGCFTRIGYNKKKCSLNYLGPLFSNLSQNPRGRQLICNKPRRLLQRLLPFTHHSESVIRRGGAIGLLKNVCFDSSIHEWLFSDDVDIIPYILLPLAGPEEYDDEDNDKFPTELQYLGPEKTREEDPDLRKMLLECLAQLCATKAGREYLRSKGTYEILREFHKWELNHGCDQQSLVACENVVDVIIRTEEEIGEDNLKELEIPEDVVEKIETMNKDETIVNGT